MVKNPTPPSQALPMEEPQKSHEACTASSGLGDGLNPHSSAKPTDTKAAEAVSNDVSADFEAWAKNMRWNLGLHADGSPYKNSAVWAGWMAWQASRCAYHTPPVKTPAEEFCPSCGGNDANHPCAYPSENKRGCMRDERLKSVKTPAQGDVVEAAESLIAAHKYAVENNLQAAAIMPNIEILQETIAAMPQQEEMSETQLLILAQIISDLVEDGRPYLGSITALLRKHIRVKREGRAV